MNRVNDRTNIPNPWLDREKLPRAPKNRVILSALVLLLSALGLPISLWSGISPSIAEWIAIALLAVLCVYLFKTVRGGPTLALLLCTAFFLTFSGMSFTGGAFILSIVVCIGAGAFLMTTTGRPYLMLLCYAVAFLTCMTVTRDPIGSLLTIASLPAALLMGFATLKGMARTRVICFAMGGLFVTVVLLLIFYLIEVGVAFEREALLLYAESLRENALEAVMTVRNEVLAELKAAITDTNGEQVYTQFATLYSDEMLRVTVAQLFNLLPAIVVIFCMLLAFEANCLLLSAHNSAGLGEVNTPAARILTVSLPASVVFVVSFVLMIFLPTDQLASAVAQNLTLILLPALVLVGFRRFLLLFIKTTGGIKTILLVLAVAMLCCNTGGALYLLAMLGAYYGIAEPIRSILAERKDSSSDGAPRA